MNSKGQVVVEYVLLMVIAVSIGYLLVSRLASRNADEPGILVNKWHQILVEIGKDQPDQHK